MAKGGGGKSKKHGNNKKSPACQRYLSEKRWIKNKKIKAAKHEEKLIVAQESSAINKQLISECIEKLKLENRGTYLLKRLLGTTNNKRLLDLLNNNITNQKYFKERILTKNAERILTNIPKDILKAMKYE